MGRKGISRGKIITIIIFAVLLLDQAFKIWIKTHFTLHQSVNVLGDWFQLCFVENEGMAFGMVLGGDFGKLFLSLFRIVLSAGIIWYIRKLLKNPETPMGVLVGLSMVLVGALGNILDSAFYGLIFSESGVTSVATLFPPEGSYGTFLHGKVVDMLYFPLVDTVLPDNFPILGGRRFVFFQFIFNVADSAITCGAAYLLIFQYKFFSKK
ncbi:MAG TPA: lipoprotein signal peptidase [Bacteroidales bacterium]|nr:lipoprotein signal peptidase [Bacteroidales bacterium]